MNYSELQNKVNIEIPAEIKSAGNAIDALEKIAANKVDKKDLEDYANREYVNTTATNLDTSISNKYAAADKKILEDAKKYTDSKTSTALNLEVATVSKLGGVKSGGDISISPTTGIMSVVANSHTHTEETIYSNTYPSENNQYCNAAYMMKWLQALCDANNLNMPDNLVETYQDEEVVNIDLTVDRQNDGTAKSSLEETYIFEDQPKAYPLIIKHSLYSLDEDTQDRLWSITFSTATGSVTFSVPEIVPNAVRYTQMNYTGDFGEWWDPSSGYTYYDWEQDPASGSILLSGTKANYTRLNWPTEL